MCLIQYDPPSATPTTINASPSATGANRWRVMSGHLPLSFRPCAGPNRVLWADASELLGLPNGLWFCFLVAASLSAATYEHHVIAAVIAGEASSQGRTGMVAVAEVIRQRVRESGWTPFRVVNHGNRRGIYAFSCLNKTAPSALVNKWQRDPAWAIALELAQMLCDVPAQLPDTTLRANFFARAGWQPEWARGRKPVMVIKDHAFYRIPVAPGRRRAW